MKNLNDPKYREYSERYGFWQNLSLNQLSFSNNLFLVAAFTSIGFIYKQMPQSGIYYTGICNSDKNLTLIVVAVILFSISIFSGFSCVLTRIADIRITRNIILTIELYNEFMKDLVLSYTIKKALKRLHLLNLFSMLRMVQKPVLGIANGFSLMCENPHISGTAGLAFFPLALSQPLDSPPLPGKYNATLCNSMMFIEAEELESLYFEKLFRPSSDEFNAAVLTGFNGIPAAFKKGNYMGISFNPEYSGTAGNLILNSFLEI